jgi:uncharacterized membrane protein YfbV (UPF0208 family)
VLDQRLLHKQVVAQVVEAVITEALKEQGRVVMTAVTQLYKVVAVWVKELLGVQHLLDLHRQQFK